MSSVTHEHRTKAESQTVLSVSHESMDCTPKQALNTQPGSALPDWVPNGSLLEI